MSIKTVTYSKDKQLSEHFMLHEFKCKASDTIKYSEETIELLERIFTACPKISKAIITSGYRTPEYSVKVGGSKDDGHTVGIAVDVKFYDKQNHIISPEYIACVAQDIGFTGIGIMNNSIHLDTRTASNYKNGKWWGDERNGKNNIADFYSYSSLNREKVNSVLGRKEEKTDVVYQVWDSARKAWLPRVKNTDDYAGIFGHSICAVFAELSDGDIFYKVHTKGLLGRWLPEVKNHEDYAGKLSKPIDAVMFRTNNGKKILYSVHIKNGKWLPFVCGYDEKDRTGGFAGIIGKEIDAIRMYIE